MPLSRSLQATVDAVHGSPLKTMMKCSILVSIRKADGMQIIIMVPHDVVRKPRSLEDVYTSSRVYVCCQLRNVSIHTWVVQHYMCLSSVCLSAANENHMLYFSTLLVRNIFAIPLVPPLHTLLVTATTMQSYACHVLGTNCKMPSYLDTVNLFKAT